jgi:hypothetical protein
LATDPLTQLWTSDVMSISKNWLKLDVVMAMGCPPVADSPNVTSLL